MTKSNSDAIKVANYRIGELSKDDETVSVNAEYLDALIDIKREHRKLKIENRNMKSVINEGISFLDGIIFSGRKCGENDCSIHVHANNIHTIKEILCSSTQTNKDTD